MSEITKEEAIRRTVVAQMIVAECQAAEALRDQLSCVPSAAYDYLFEAAEYTPQRGWTIGDKNGDIERGLIALISKDFSNASDKDLQAAEDLYSKVSRLMDRVNQGYMTRKQAADEMGVDIAEVDGENERDKERMETLQPSMWTTLPDDFAIAGVDTRTDGGPTVAYATLHPDGTLEYHS